MRPQVRTLLLVLATATTLDAAAQMAPTPARAGLLAAPGTAAERRAALASGDAAAAKAATAELGAITALPPPEPAPVVDAAAPISADNLVWDAEVERLLARLAFPEEIPPRRLLNAKPDKSRAGRRLIRLVASGEGAGLLGDLYDNRDRGHSSLNLRDYPGLAATEYSEAAKAAGLDLDLNEDLLFNAITIGNASKALTGGPLWRSLPRRALTSGYGAARLFQNFAANQLYVFPEHHDHDPEKGDLFPAAPPYVWISQGSSGSDRAYLRALADILAALRPETKALLREKGLVAPTAQMIFRRAYAGDESGAAYLDGAAHPSVFDHAPDRERLIARANALAADAVPPMPRLAVLREPALAQGIQLFGEGLDERLFDTPSAVARLARGTAGERRYLLGAAAADPNGRPVTFRWVVLRGDPGRVRLTPQEEGRTAEVAIDWSGPRPVPGRPEIMSPRVDIGLFAHNGVEWSAPAIFSLYFPQDRAVRHDAKGRPLEIDYKGGAEGAYVDPALFPAREWRDVYAYDRETGDLLGWTRFRGEMREDFTRHGFRVLARDAEGRPTVAERVAYPVSRDARGVLSVEERLTGERVGYAYDGAEDRLGWLTEPNEEE